ncbi:hypothetical protein [Reichenbachiella versicolor]|uniref:hypothetical protein n=1 Tax=Reichenbachiella versicolor TaxID=1821036 RepID=UPI0013A54709|nr:hypothetical protein [Reichenbachiella versicolor]
MVRLIMALAVIVLSMNVASAQTKFENQSKFVTEKMAEKFGLSKKKQKEFYEARLALAKTGSEYWVKNKNGEFASKEEYDKARGAATKPYQDKLIELCGGDSRAYWRFNKELMPEVKKIQ